MTRLNIGIMPSELCDQHLIAEYRELPRMRAFALARLAKYGDCGPRPTMPTLGSGHMAFFLPYGNELSVRFSELRLEMMLRGIIPKLQWREYPFHDAFMYDECRLACRTMLIPRIRDRLHTMKRTPTWTNSTPPEWANV